jgi:hypothetical protein
VCAIGFDFEIDVSDGGEGKLEGRQKIREYKRVHSAAHFAQILRNSGLQIRIPRKNERSKSPKVVNFPSKSWRCERVSW